jgi:hypothetical protein
MVSRLLVDKHLSNISHNYDFLSLCRPNVFRLNVFRSNDIKMDFKYNAECDNFAIMLSVVAPWAQLSLDQKLLRQTDFSKNENVALKGLRPVL